MPGGKIFTVHVSDKGLATRIWKDVLEPIDEKKKKGTQ